MITFPESVLDGISKLRGICSEKTIVVISYPIVEILKEANDLEVSTKLFFNYKDGTFEIQPPTYRYFSKVSHFDFRKPERRWSRNKNNLLPLIDKLKTAGLWDIVSNKDFLVVNEHNDKVDVKKLSHVLKGL